jgi:N-carbamoyl-L-amino-acid hydrolase
LTDEDKACRDLLASWCREAGFRVEVDSVGSMFATRAGRERDALPLLIGSHLDSQPYAGAYDGPLGVLAALEVMESLNDHGIETPMPIQLVNWTNEEGARFRPPLLASGVFAGQYELGFALAQKDDAGMSVGAELERIGYAGTIAPGWPVAGYIEIHIEQGTVLERAETPIGVVSGVVGIRDIKVSVTGEDTHAGPLDMSSRRDALVGAADMILAANRLGLENAPDARVTVGRIAVPSNSHSVVPGYCEFTLDLRHPAQSGLDGLEKIVVAEFREIAARRCLGVTFEPIWAYPPIEFDASLRAKIADAADALGLAHMALPSRAGHDAWNIARIAPSAMIFIPCRDGISHNEREFAEFDHMSASADVLFQTILSIATPL